jgi:hypothetical protein
MQVELLLLLEALQAMGVLLPQEVRAKSRVPTAKSLAGMRSTLADIGVSSGENDSSQGMKRIARLHTF